MSGKSSIINEKFPDENIFSISAVVAYVQNSTSDPWYADIVNFCAGNHVPKELTWHQKKKFLSDAKHYFWDESFLYKHCADQIIRRCVLETEVKDILVHCHTLECGGHHGASRTAAKVLQCGFYWPTLFKDAHLFVKSCDKCQRTGSISKRNEMPQTGITEVELFDVWGIDFIGPFPSSCGYLYILLAVDYVSKWVEAIATQKADGKTVLKFLKSHIFTRFGVPRAIVSDGGSHFCNKQFESLVSKYGVKHKVTTAYPPRVMDWPNFLTEKSSRFFRKR